MTAPWASHWLALPGLRRGLLQNAIGGAAPDQRPNRIRNATPTIAANSDCDPRAKIQ